MLSTNIEKYRLKRGLSRMELSKISGVSYRTIEFLESGKIDNPTLKTLQLLSTALRTSVTELIK